MNKFFCISLACIILAGCSQAEDDAAAGADAAASGDGQWAVDHAQSKLEFVAEQTGAEFRGRFEDWSADIVFDPEDLANASITVTVAMDSAKTGDRQRDSALPGSDWFAAKTHPTATFESYAVRQTGEAAYEADGVLKIRDVEKGIVLPFVLEINDDTGTAFGAVDLIRTDFGVGQGEEFAGDKWVAFSVKVEYRVVAKR